jgi:hypothetical protein
MQHVDPYFVASDDESDAVLAVHADYEVAFNQRVPIDCLNSRTVVVECSDCLSTPGKNDCICPPVSHSRIVGLDNDHFVATQDWQEYEFRQGMYTLKMAENGPLVEKDIWIEEIATGTWSLLYRAESTVIDLAKYLKRKFDRNIWSVIASYFNTSYYNTGKEQYPFLKDIYAYYCKDIIACSKLFDATHRVAYSMPIRGYCLRCGEPVVNNRCSSGILRYMSSRKFLKLITKKYVLGVMGLCHRCNITGFQWDPCCKRVVIADALMQGGNLQF